MRQPQEVAQQHTEQQREQQAEQQAQQLAEQQAEQPAPPLVQQLSQQQQRAQQLATRARQCGMLCALITQRLRAEGIAENAEMLHQAYTAARSRLFISEAAVLETRAAMEEMTEQIQNASATVMSTTALLHASMSPPWAGCVAPGIVLLCRSCVTVASGLGHGLPPSE